MSRKPAEWTASTPYKAHWDAVDQNIGSSDADQAPVEMVGLEGQDGVLLSMACSAADLNAVFELVLVDYTREDGDSNPALIRAITVDVCTCATSGRTHYDGANGYYFAHQAGGTTATDVSPQIFVPIGAAPSGGSKEAPRNRLWFLRLVSLAGTTPTVYLLDYWPAKVTAAGATAAMIA